MARHFKSISLAIAGGILLAGAAPPKPAASSADANRALVLKFYDDFFNKHEIAAGEKYLVEDYKQHNPMVPDGRKAVLGFFSDYFKNHPESRARIVRSAVDGDLVWLHVHATADKNDRGLAVVDIFRVKNDRIVEHWDVVQEVPEKAANSNTMF